MPTYSFALLLAMCGLEMRSALGFQSQLDSISFVHHKVAHQHKDSILRPLSELNAKFKLDNAMEDDDEDANRNIPVSLQNIDMSIQDELQNVESYNSPATTFGAEAVPIEQRPANEYLNLISAPFFDWANRPSGSAGLAIRLGVLYAITFGAVCWPISGATFTVDGYLFHQILSSHIGALGFILVFSLRLYSGWGYIGSRLTSKDIEFEENGW